MRPSLTDILLCPRCRRPGGFELEVFSADEREVREGALTCRSCGQRYSVEAGIVDLLFEPPEFVVREAAGLERFADVMRADGWDGDRIRALPDVEDGYWLAQRRALGILLANTELEPGRRLLDIGSATCWASNVFAQRGLEVTALDISAADLQGLRTAEYFLDASLYFERVLGVMFAIPLADQSVDYVFCSEVLHHNDAANLRRTLREIHRVLRPGGQLWAINEPLRFPVNLKRDHAAEVAAFEGHEHVYFFHQYYLAAKRAGFQVRVRAPHDTHIFDPWGTRPRRFFKPARRRIEGFTKRHRPARALMLAYKTLIAGDVSLSMIATKPGP